MGQLIKFVCLLQKSGYHVNFRNLDLCKGSHGWREKFTWPLSNKPQLASFTVAFHLEPKGGW